MITYLLVLLISVHGVPEAHVLRAHNMGAAECNAKKKELNDLRIPSVRADCLPVDLS